MRQPVFNISRVLAVLLCLTAWAARAQVVPFYVDYAITNYAMGNGASALWLGNLRGHSTWRDIVTANATDNSVSVRLGVDNGTFGTRVTYPVGATPMGVITGDFDRDGFEDVAVANFGDNNVGILMNQRSGLLGAQTTYSVGAGPNPGPIAITAADLDKDGRADLIVANYGEGSVSVLRGLGNGVFASPVNYTVGSGPRSVCAADMDGDGFVDILVANSLDDTLTVLPNMGNGTFGSPVTIFLTGGAQPYCALAVDLNQDGKQDIVVACHGMNAVIPYIAQAPGPFQYAAGATYGVGTGPSGLVSRDFNNDGNYDIAVANSGSGSVSVLLGFGDGTFDLGNVSFAAGTQPVAIASSHFNGDNVMDLAVADAGGAAVVVLNHDIPVVYNVTATTVENFPTSVTLKGSVYRGRSISFTTGTNGLSHGTVTNTGAVATYAPEPDFIGTAQFQFESSDGVTNSAVGTATVGVVGLISLPPASHTNLIGSTNVFKVVTVKVPTPVKYQWYFNTTNLIVNATNATFAAGPVRDSSAGSYTVVLSNAVMVAAVTSSPAVLVALPDTVLPTATISAPLSMVRLSNNVATATGTAMDNTQVTNVLYQLNGSAWQSASTTNSWKTWSAVLTGQLAAGTNTLIVKSVDFSGNETAVGARPKRIFFLVVNSTLTLLSTGSGTFLPNLDGASLEVGRGYTVTAVPAAGQVLNDWNGNDGTFSEVPKLTFVMKTNLILQADFIDTPFNASVAGIYNGLFYESGNVMFSTSGFITFTVNSNGLFSGRLYLGGTAYGIPSTLFTAGGVAHFTIARTTAHLPSLSVDLQLDVNGGSGMVSGTVQSLDNAWTADFAGDRAVFTTANPTPNAGRYTFYIPGTSDPSVGPSGNGFGLVTVSPNGMILLSGKLGDGTPAAQASGTVSINQFGQWPLYLPLYAGKGALLGWVTMSSIPGDFTNLTGTVVWTRLANGSSVYYPAGFTNIGVDLVGSGYQAPPVRHAALQDPVTTFIIDGADLGSAIVNPVTLTSNNTVIVDPPNPQKLKIVIAPANGAISGSFVNTTTGFTNTFTGTLMQNQNQGAGEFQSIDSAGYILLQ